MVDKLTKAKREQIIFDFLKGKENPLYEVSQTNHGKWLVKARPVEIEEETVNEEPEDETEDDEQMNEPQQMKPINNRQQA